MAARDGARREIPWDAPLDVSIDPAKRRAVGASWRARMAQEHLAVGAFAMLATELAACGCDPVVLSMITRASSDEVRHAEVCRRLASRLLGEGAVASRLKGVPRIPRHPGRAPAEVALLHVVEMCCFNETFTGVFLTEMLEGARDPTARAAVESLLEDEIDHGRVGWAHVAATLRDGGGGCLAEALPAIAERTMAPVLDGRGDSAPTDPAMAALGYVSDAGGAEIYRRTFREVVLPGFEALKVDTTPLRERARSRGWMA